MNIFYDFITFLAFLSFSAVILLWILKSPLRIFIMEMSKWFKKTGWLLRIGTVSIMLILWNFASTKTNQTQQTSSPITQQLEMILSSSSVSSGLVIDVPDNVSSNNPPELSAAAALSGFAAVNVETNPVHAIWDISGLSSNTPVYAFENWTRTGRASDGAYLSTNGLWGFQFNAEEVQSVFCSVNGTLSFGDIPVGSEVARDLPCGENFRVMAPLWGPLSIVPDTGSVFAYPTNQSLVVVWKDMLLDRTLSTNQYGSLQCELQPGGNFVFRYNLPSESVLTNHVVGAGNGLYGESVTLTGGTNTAEVFEIFWHGFQPYTMDAASNDTDSDGISDYDEVYGTYATNGTYDTYSYLTSPSKYDTDFDGWSDGYELTNAVYATNPLNPDTDGDGLLDSVDSDPLSWEDVSAVSTNDGCSTEYHTDNGRPKEYDLATDSDGDGIPDWIEQLCSTSETNAGSCCYNGEDYFEVSISLAADLPAPVILKIGPRILCLRYAGTRSLILAAGQAHAVTLLACERCLVNLGISFSTGKAVLLNPSAVFSGGAVLPAGTEQAGGTIALARVNVDPGLICFHSSGSKTAIGSPVPDMPGTYTWSWFEEAGESVTLTGKTVNISWQGGGSSRSLNLAFRPDGATEDIYGYKTVYRCTLTEDNPGGDVADWIDPDDPPYPPYNWPQSPEETEERPSTNNAADPGEPFYGAKYGIAIAVNNDDDDADGKLDNESTEDRVTGDDDLYASYLYTPFAGGCCPCPAHNPEVSAVSIEYISPKLRLWDDAQKITASTGVNSGQMQYLEGVTPSTSVTGEPLILSWTEDDESKAKTNRYTVFSLRMFGDYNLDGTVNSTDYAAASSISDNGWNMPVASNTLRRLVLKNNVLIPGNLILHLSGSSGIRIWDTPNPASTNTPLLVAGQTITNGVDGLSFGAYPDGMLYVEAIDAGTATLCYSYRGTGDAEDFGCVTLLSITAEKSVVEIFVGGTAVATNTLHIARWEQAFSNGYFQALGFTLTNALFKTSEFINADSDRFQIKVTDESRIDQDSVTVLISTEHPTDSTYDTPQRIAELQSIEPGVFISTNLLLVSDWEDFSFNASSYGCAPNSTNRTFLSQLGSCLKVKYNDGWGETNIVNATVGSDVKTLTVDVAIMRTNGVQCVDSLSALSQVSLAKERIAQADIIVELGSLSFFDAPSQIDVDLWRVADTNNYFKLSQESRSIVHDALVSITNSSDNICLIFVPSLRGGDGMLIAGHANASYWYVYPDDLPYVNHCLISAQMRPFVSAHEICHVLNIRTHKIEKCNLMHETAAVSRDVDSSKRMFADQVLIIQSGE